MVVFHLICHAPLGACVSKTSRGRCASACFFSIYISHFPLYISSSVPDLYSPCLFTSSSVPLLYSPCPFSSSSVPNLYSPCPFTSSPVPDLYSPCPFSIFLCPPCIFLCPSQIFCEVYKKMCILHHIFLKFSALIFIMSTRL